MNALFSAASEVQKFIEEHQWLFCFIGGLAVIRWGEIRVTKDVDLTILTRFKDEETYVDTLLKRFSPRIEDPKVFALTNRVLLLKTDNGIGVDISLAGFPYEEEVVRRSSLFEYAPGCVIRTCSADDLIVLKVFAGRHQDWFDVEGILLRNEQSLDFGYIDENISMLCDLIDKPERLEEFKTLCEKSGCRSGRAGEGNIEREAWRVGRAQEIFRRFYAQCFWHYDKDLQIGSHNIQLVLDGLRKYGGREGMLLAEELCR